MRKISTFAGLTIASIWLFACGSNESNSTLHLPLDRPFFSQEEEFSIAKGILELVTVINMDCRYTLKASEFGLDIFYPKLNKYLDLPHKDNVGPNASTAKKSNFGTIMKNVKALPVGQSQTFKLQWIDAEGDEHYIEFLVVKTQANADGIYEVQLVLVDLYLTRPGWAWDIRKSKTSNIVNKKRVKPHGEYTPWVVFFVNAEGKFSGLFDPDRSLKIKF